MAETPLSAPTAPATADLRERLPAQPGGAQLLAAATEIAPVGAFLVGGAVRDLLLGTRPRELDVVVEGGEGPFGQAAMRLAGALATRLGAGASVNQHERFGTAIVEWEEEGEGARIDIATARRERYPAPGALPEVEPGSLAEDLERRDFTVNTLACALDGARPGAAGAVPNALEDLAPAPGAMEESRAVPGAMEESRAVPGAMQESRAVPGALEKLQSVPGALEDLRARRLRVLHERSFLDDATRLWRLARYRARLGFAVEEHTAQLAATAVAEGALRTVSLARIGAELRLALGEADPHRGARGA